MDHKACFACGSDNREGLGLKFFHRADGKVEALFNPTDRFKGHDGLLHGGIICTILDSAMTTLLLNRGISAVTAKMEVRFHRPILISNRVKVMAKMVKQKGRFYEIASSVLTEGAVAATAIGKFLVIDSGG